MSEIITLAQAGAVVMACWAIISGIGAWKREFIGKRQIELAEQVLANFFEIKDAIAMIRSPFSHSGEGSPRQKGEYEAPETAKLLDRGYIVFERYSKEGNCLRRFLYAQVPVYGLVWGRSGANLHRYKFRTELHFCFGPNVGHTLLATARPSANDP